MPDRKETPRKPLHWMGSSLADLRKLSEDVKDVFGFALHQAQLGARHIDAKPLKGFGGAGVLEVLTDDRGGGHTDSFTPSSYASLCTSFMCSRRSRKPESERPKRKSG